MATIKETIEALTNENGFSWGLNSVMGILRPGCLYELSAEGGNFRITRWDENQWSETEQKFLQPPTSQEIRDEYIRQQTISECIKHFTEQSN
jgi:hypothetical protein